MIKNHMSAPYLIGNQYNSTHNGQNFIDELNELKNDPKYRQKWLIEANKSIRTPLTIESFFLPTEKDLKSQAIFSRNLTLQSIDPKKLTSRLFGNLSSIET